jgi:hypothetical protein
LVFTDGQGATPVTISNTPLVPASIDSHNVPSLALVMHYSYGGKDFLVFDGLAARSELANGQIQIAINPLFRGKLARVSLVE